MGPGSLGAQEAVDGDLTDAELAGAFGTDTSVDLPPRGTSINEAIASGNSPGSLGAQEAVTGDLTVEELDALYGTDVLSGLDGGTDLGTVIIRGTPDDLSPLVDMGETTSTTIPEVVATTPTVVKPVITPVIKPVIKPPVVAKPAATTTGGLPTTSYLDQTAIPGKLLKVGQMGTDMTDHKLKQLYDSLTASPAAAYSYVNDVNPETLNIAQLESQPFQQPQQPMYAHGGLVRLADGGQPDEVMSALKQLGAIGFDSKVASPKLLQQGQMGGSYNPKVLPQLAALLQARGMKLAGGGQPDDHTHPNYDGIPLLRTGGLSGLGGKYVEGKGDGTSDDIAAMLANGEYVFSADVVSALGNGSNKSGAEALDHMVQAIRERARSAPADELPPDAKSPLEYLKSSKGKKNA